jgi:glycosyltransferase involved in cell wall biosynthesis
MLHVTLKRNSDVVILVNGINAFIAWMPRLVGIRVYLNVDGIERQRDKWGAVAKSAYYFSEYLGKHTATGIISDADVVAEYYRERHKVDSVVIRYGAPVKRKPDLATLTSLGLEVGQYVLYVSRLEPENNAHQVIMAYRQVESDLPLLVVGDAPYADNYKEHLMSLAVLDPRVVMTGALYGPTYRALLEGATVYVQATSVGGTHPALVEAMGAGNAVLANRTPEHVEVLRTAGAYYSGVPELAHNLQLLLSNADLRRQLGAAAQREISQRFSWEAVTRDYERLIGVPS